jgi:hypothetical protein
MQYIKLTTYYHIFVKQLMTDFCLFQSQNGNNTVLLMLFVIMINHHIFKVHSRKGHDL